MKNLIISLVIGVMVGSASFGAEENAAVDKQSNPTAKTENAIPAQSAASTNAARTEKTEHSFEDLLVQGKYHFSDEAVTTVEEDKVLDALLGIRTDFKDKIEQSAGRY